jgi:hypothetical protein
MGKLGMMLNWIKRALGGWMGERNTERERLNEVPRRKMLWAKWEDMKSNSIIEKYFETKQREFEGVHFSLNNFGTNWWGSAWIFKRRKKFGNLFLRNMRKIQQGQKTPQTELRIQFCTIFFYGKYISQNAWQPVMGPYPVGKQKVGMSLS